MIITDIKVENFRNLEEVTIAPDPRINILYGSNAQGKTNVLEAICVGSASGSFRNSKDQEMIKSDRDRMRLVIGFDDKTRSQTIDYSVESVTFNNGAYVNKIAKNKVVEINGIKTAISDIKDRILECVVFTPDDLTISKGSPENRRSYLDRCISQMKKSYKIMICKYYELLEQRNSNLKLISLGRSDPSVLDIWDKQISEYGATVSMMRYIYCKNINKFASLLYSEMTNGAESFRINYHSSIYKELEGRKNIVEDLAKEYLGVLRANRENDIEARLTQKGVHRDDVQFYINGEYARKISSQGQHRSMTLTLKLAHAYLLNEIMGEPPVILLDDVLSELDIDRQRFVLERIGGMQVFITCCDEDLIDAGAYGKKFFVEGGRVTERKHE